MAGWIREKLGLSPAIDGQQVNVTGQPAIYFTDLGELRHIPDVYTLTNLFQDPNTILSVPSLAGYTISVTPISEGAAIVSRQGDDTVYLVDNGQKRAITADAMKWCNFQSPVQVPYILLDYISDGPLIDYDGKVSSPQRAARSLPVRSKPPKKVASAPLAAAVSPQAPIFADGTWLMDPFGAYWLVMEGQRRQAPDAPTLKNLKVGPNALGVDWPTLELVPLGPKFSRGALLAAGRISHLPYLIDLNMKRQVTTTAFDGVYHFPPATVVPDITLDCIPGGPILDKRVADEKDAADKTPMAQAS
jgi:hypothetical protein